MRELPSQEDIDRKDVTMDDLLSKLHGSIHQHSMIVGGPELQQDQDGVGASSMQGVHRQT